MMRNVHTAQFRGKHFATICVPQFPCPANGEGLNPSRTG